MIDILLIIIQIFNLLCYVIGWVLPLHVLDETFSEYADMAHWASVCYDAEVPDIADVLF